jgi:hypothetical protein
MLFALKMIEIVSSGGLMLLALFTAVGVPELMINIM